MTNEVKCHAEFDHFGKRIYCAPCMMYGGEFKCRNDQREQGEDSRREQSCENAASHQSHAEQVDAGTVAKPSGVDDAGSPCPAPAAGPSAVETEDARHRMQHDFYMRHATGSLECPSCLRCEKHHDPHRTGSGFHGMGTERFCKLFRVPGETEYGLLVWTNEILERVLYQHGRKAA